MSKISNKWKSEYWFISFLIVAIAWVIADEIIGSINAGPVAAFLCGLGIAIFALVFRGKR